MLRGSGTLLLQLASVYFIFSILGLESLLMDSIPEIATFADLIDHPNPKEAEVSILDVSEWDPQGQYKEVVQATREASKGSDVRVYRIAKEGTRIEYWVVGVEDGKLVGAKALAIES